MKTFYNVLLSDPSYQRFARYLDSLKSGGSPGHRLAETLRDQDIAGLDVELLVDFLFRTKKPRIFAESEVYGDGRDWNAVELSLLGDLTVAMEVTVFDNGRHQLPEVHPEPFRAGLLFTPGALLRNDTGGSMPDLQEVSRSGVFDREAYYRLYERRLLAPLRFANQEAARKDRPALVTVPGIGCGQFAGPFNGRLGSELGTVLARLLETHGKDLSHLQAVYYDPYSEAENARFEFHGIRYLVRPLRKGNLNKPQLCRPEQYAEPGDDFRDCMLFSFVAWDHVSWPGNDYFAGMRTTDDGVKAAATSAMKQVTGFPGWYDPDMNCYRPPSPYRHWEELVLENKVNLQAAGRLTVL